MSDESCTRFLSIGEFAAATQLTPKALRLYDEQQLLQPARTDAASGYRYYRVEQVAAGRLIRTLREMNLSLADVARVMAAEGQQREALLREFASNVDQRYAREKRAYQSALLLLHEGARAAEPRIEARARPAMTVIVRPFMADRRYFYERMRAELRAAEAMLEGLSPQAHEECYCRLIEPLSEEEAPVELLLPADTLASLPSDVTLRRLPPALCAVSSASIHNSQGPDFSAPADAIFDWFDRLGHRAVDAPWLHYVAHRADVHVEIIWAYEPAAPAMR